MEIARHPILCTPNSKRRLAEDVEWMTPGKDAEEPRTPARQKATPGRQRGTPGRQKKTQTPINSFLIPKSVEERRREMEKLYQARKYANPEMSSSPKLNRIRISHTRSPGSQTLSSRCTCRSERLSPGSRRCSRRRIHPLDRANHHSRLKCSSCHCS